MTYAVVLPSMESVNIYINNIPVCALHIENRGTRIYLAPHARRYHLARPDPAHHGPVQSSHATPCHDRTRQGRAGHDRSACAGVTHAHSADNTRRDARAHMCRVTVPEHCAGLAAAAMVPHPASAPPTLTAHPQGQHARGVPFRSSSPLRALEM